MTKEEIKNIVLKSGVNNLKTFGYPEVNKENILTDEVYKEFFKSMLKENLGSNENINQVINYFLEVLK